MRPLTVRRRVARSLQLTDAQVARARVISTLQLIGPSVARVHHFPHIRTADDGRPKIVCGCGDAVCVADELQAAADCWWDHVEQETAA